MTDITLPQALAFRLDRQHLTRPAAQAMMAAATLIGAQAQVHSAAILQLRARAEEGTTEAAIDHALYQDRSLVKLWAQRSTLHLMPAADLPLILSMRREQVASYLNWYAKEGLSPAQVDILVEAVVQTLQAQGPQSRMDLSRQLVPHLGEWARPMLEHSWGGIVKLACALGHVCHGPAERADGEGSREALFVHLANWLGQAPSLPDARTAMAALLHRYLRVYGPATPRDFNKFIGFYAGPAHQAFADLGDEIVPVMLAGKRAHILADDLDTVRQSAPAEGQITVLGLFDPWLLAHQDTSQYLDDRFRPAIYRTAGWISPVILRQGRVIATWTHKNLPGPQGGTWEVVISPLERVYKKDLPAITRGLRRLSGGRAIRLVP